MISGNFSLRVTIFTSDGEQESYTFSWDNTTIGHARGQMISVAGRIAGSLREGGIIQISSDGMIYNCDHVVKVLLEASPEELQNHINQAVSR